MLMIAEKGAVTKQPLNFFIFLSKKGPEGPFSLV